MTDAAIQQKLAAMFAANKDEVSVPKIYIDMTGGWETGAVLDELMFWTLPKKNTGKTSLRVFRNEFLWLAVRRSEWWERKRLTERQADNAIGKLITQGLIEKDVFLFDGKPTVHLRLITSKFAALYAEKLQEIAVGEDDENLIRDIADLYTMMGFPPQNVISNLQNGEMLNLQNGEIINSPIQPENNNTANAGLKTDELQGIYKSADRKVDAIIEQSRKAAQQTDYWQGRENIPPHLLKYADWWNKRTGQEMKGKVKADYLKEWTAWNNDELPLSALDEAFEYVNGWKSRQGGRVAHPREITKDAVGFAANPKQEVKQVKKTDDGMPESW